MLISELVRREVRARFSPADAPEVEYMLGATPLPLLDAPDRRRERDRVHLAILKLASGNFNEITRHLAVAASDWRDVLVAAGMGHANWPEVLERSGFPVPPET
ncbi:MAG: hypothetical protein ACREBE_09895 [bacterium]